MNKAPSKKQLKYERARLQIEATRLILKPSTDTAKLKQVMALLLSK